MRTPSSALPACPHGFDDGRGRPLPAAAFAAGFLAALSFTAFLADSFAAVLVFALAAFLRGAIISSP
jgi:hypothetical protein